MNLDFVAKSTDLDDPIRRFAEEQLGKVTRFLEEPIEIRLKLDAEKHRRIADLHIGHRFGVIQATDETDDLREAIRLAIEKAEKQAKRSRKKHKDRKRRPKKTMMPLEWPLEVIDAASVKSEAGPTIIEKRTVSLDLLSLDEALARLESVGLGFFVFRDFRTGRVSVLYKRHDDTLGLLSPEI
jgi:putative sigma-54 modulation protein